MSDVTSHQSGEAPQNGFRGKDGMQEDFSNYMQPSSQQPNYQFAPSEPFIPSYYGQMAFPSYMGGEWSTAGDSMSYMSHAYSNIGNGEPHRNFVQEPMFNQQNNAIGNGQAYFNAPVFQQGNEFNAWTSPSSHSGLDVNVGHQSGASNYNGDFYHQILPTMPQDYLERNEYVSNTAPIGSSHAQQAEFMSGVFSGGDAINKMPGTSSSMHSLEHGMQNLMTNTATVSEPPSKVGQPVINAVPQLPDTPSQQVDYNNPQVPVKLNSVNNNTQPAPTNKPISWAAIASKPAKPQAKPKPKVSIGLPPPVKHSVDSTNWDGNKPTTRGIPGSQPGARNYGWNGTKMPNQLQEDGEDSESRSDKDESKSANAAGSSVVPHPVLDKLQLQNEYNPKRLTMDLRNSRFFVIKSYSEDDIHRSIKYNIWCSTEHGNKRLDTTFRNQKNRGPVILLYSVNGSGHFCGVAEMKTCVDYSSRPGVWSQDKWKGQFQVKWIYVKDVPNTVLRHIRLENNDNKPVTNSRDTQEVPAEKGRQVLKIIANYKHQTSIFDDFGHYERRQQEEEDQKTRAAQAVTNRERKTVDSHTPYAVRNTTA